MEIGKGDPDGEGGEQGVEHGKAGLAAAIKEAIETKYNPNQHAVRPIDGHILDTIADDSGVRSENSDQLTGENQEEQIESSSQKQGTDHTVKSRLPGTLRLVRADILGGHGGDGGGKSGGAPKIRPPECALPPPRLRTVPGRSC